MTVEPWVRIGEDYDLVKTNFLSPVIAVGFLFSTSRSSGVTFSAHTNSPARWQRLGPRSVSVIPRSCTMMLLICYRLSDILKGTECAHTLFCMVYRSRPTLFRKRHSNTSTLAVSGWPVVEVEFLSQTLFCGMFKSFRLVPQKRDCS